MPRIRWILTLKKVTKVIADKTQLLTTYNFKEKTPTKASDLVTNPLDIEAQVAALEKCKKKVHL